MARRHVVVDGSNLATEGRTLPSLAQLGDALDSLRAEFSDATVTVVVDASFAHRIDESERGAYESAAASGDFVSPPAGAIGRGDGFLLQIADRTGAIVLSNDSFQEFHGTYAWLFDTGRLIGAKPVPGVGWIFSVRNPVRGEKSRRSVRDAKKPAKTPKVVQAAIKEASADALEDGSGKKRSRRSKSRTPPPGAVNDPNPFLRFVAEHLPGTEVEGRVDEYASNGAFVDVDGVRCYVPLAALGEPKPAAARDVLRKGEVRRFVVQSFDTPRRGVELALPEYAHVSGAPTEETVAASITEGSARTARRRRQRQQAKARARELGSAPAKAKRTAKKKTARKATVTKAAVKPAPAKKAPKKAPAKKSAAAKKRPAKKAPAKKAKAKSTKKR